jgi:hypothetical protein
VLAPLTLEPYADNFSIIDEVDRVLKPMGYAVLLCINPWSLWGGALKYGFLSCFANEHSKSHSAFTINRLFTQRGYRQCALYYFCYTPPMKNQKFIHKLAFLEEVGKMLWPFPAGFFCYIAQKYEHIHPDLVIEPALTKELQYNSALQPQTTAVSS